MAIDEERIAEFFDEYAAALREFDADATARLWGLPGMIVTDEFAGALESRADMSAGLASSYPAYRMLGLESAVPEIRAVSALTDRIVTVRVRWSHLDADDELIVTTDYEYLLRDDADGLHVYLAVGIDEAEALQRAARDRGVDLDLYG
ncbi:hypothetical protein [Agromyces bauzanensis]|uniref:DUF6841 domain-containing protein n=1 Tax=Agromyces bauzanensis TaxID=1308924 RepID=A0A917P8H1_9MICO|nr:hypothetical protein [Agromyces bauzanensis]GGJ66690.1 hypothetical protein GCM10011372_00490 [Agromyces bauzanensis]